MNTTVRTCKNFITSYIVRSSFLAFRHLECDHSIALFDYLIKIFHGGEWTHLRTLGATDFQTSATGQYLAAVINKGAYLFCYLELIGIKRFALYPFCQ